MKVANGITEMRNFDVLSSASDGFPSLREAVKKILHSEQDDFKNRTFSIKSKSNNLNNLNNVNKYSPLILRFVQVTFNSS